MKAKVLKSIVNRVSQGKDSRIGFCGTGIVGFSRTTEIQHSAFKSHGDPFSISLKQAEGIIQLFEPDEDVSIKCGASGFSGFSGFATFETPSATVTIACQNFGLLEINETPLVEQFYPSLGAFKNTFALAEKCRESGVDILPGVNARGFLTHHFNLLPE